MLYTFPAEYYLTGVNSRCYAPRNTALSERDRQALRTAYPTATPDQIAAGRAQAASAILEAAAADNNPRGFAGRPDSRRYFTTRIALSQLSTDQLRMLSASTSAPLTTLDFANSGVAIAADNATWRDLTSDRYFERRNNALRVRTADQLEGALGRTASRANVAQ